MRVIGTKLGSHQDPTRYFKFSRFSKQAGDFVLLEAGFGFKKILRWNQYDFTQEELKRILSKKIVRLDFEEPNKFCVGDNPNDYDGDFYKIFTICPHTADWLNKIQKNSKHVPIYFPFNEQYIPKETSKKYDVIYTGHILSKPILNDIKTISKFNFKVVSNSNHFLVTNKSVSYKKKLKLISESRITLVHNLLFLSPGNILYLWRIPGWHKNKAFKFVPKWYEPWKLMGNDIRAPQLKSRLFEAAFCRSLILCKKDPFRTVEAFFEKDKEFIYFEDSNLEEKIKEILKNYQDYQPIIERAYKRAVKNYTTKEFFKKYLKDLV